MRSKPILQNLLILGTSILLTCCVLEIFLRINGYEGDTERIRTVFSQFYGKVNKNSWIFEIDPSAGPSVFINDRSYPVAKSEGEKRVIFLGDSGTYGAGLPDIDLSFPFVFEDAIRRARPHLNLSVINAGVIGMTTIGEYHLLKMRLLGLKPDAVILGLFMANDINFNLAHERRVLTSRAGSWISRAYYRLIEKSALTHFLHLRLLALNSGFKLDVSNDRYQVQKVSTSPPVDQNGLSFASYIEGEVSTYYQEYSPWMNQAFDILENVLFKFKMLSQAHDFQFSVVLLPTTSMVLERLYLAKLPELDEHLRSTGQLNPDELDFHKPLRKVMEICKKLKIVCVDPTEDFKREGLKAFIKGDDHLSALGHKIVSDKLLDYSKIMLP